MSGDLTLEYREPGEDRDKYPGHFFSELPSRIGLPREGSPVGVELSGLFR